MQLGHGELQRLARGGEGAAGGPERQEVSFLASLTAAYSVFFAAPEAMCRNFFMVFLLYFVCSYQVMMGARFSALTALAPVVAMS